MAITLATLTSRKLITTPIAPSLPPCLAGSMRPCRMAASSLSRTVECSVEHFPWNRLSRHHSSGLLSSMIISVSSSLMILRQALFLSPNSRNTMPKPLVKEPSGCWVVLRLWSSVAPALVVPPSSNLRGSASAVSSSLTRTESEEKNLNRIVHATVADIGRFKVDVLADAVRGMGLGTKVVTIPRSLFDREVVQAVANADVLFGCMDSAEGRRLLNRIATYYLLPYIDLGVKLVAGSDGQIEQVSGAVHFLQPGKSSLLSRKVISPELVRAEGLRRRNPAEYASLRSERYIVGVDEDRPAVISVNMMVSSMAVNEFLARLHDFRTDGNAGFAEWRVSISHGIFHNRAESSPCPSLVHGVGLGDIEPLLDDPELSA